MAPRVFIIHGYTGYPDKNWFPWLKDQLESKGITVQVPAMPHADAPLVDEWIAHLASIVGMADENTFFVGHSLGCIAILRYLETLPAHTKVGGAVFVAAFAEAIDLTEVRNFFDVSLNDAKVKESIGKLVVINSDNDPYVPLWQAEKIRDRFGAELIVIPNGGHLNQKTGYITFPLVLEKLESLM